MKISFLKILTSFLMLQVASAQILVVTTLPVFALLAHEIGGDAIQVECLASHSTDPHFFQITPYQLEQMQKADFVISSAEIAASLPIQDNSNISISTALNSEYQPPHKAMHALAHIIKDDHGTHHCHCHHHHLDANSLKTLTHEWLSFNALEIIATTVTQKLCQEDPEHSELFQKNCNAMIHRLHELKKTYINKELKRQSLFYHNDLWIIQKELKTCFGPVLYTCDGSSLTPEMRNMLEQKKSQFQFLFVDASVAPEQIKRISQLIECKEIKLDLVGQNSHHSVTDWLNSVLEPIYLN